MINRYTKGLIIALLACFGPLAAHAQYETKADSVAASDLYYEIGQEVLKATKVVTQARDQFEIAANLNPENIWANYMTGKTYLETVHKERASKYFKRVYELDPNFRYDLLYSIGRAYQYGLNFEEALHYFNLYKEKTLSDVNYRGKDKVQLAEVERRIQECQNGAEYIKNPKHYAIVNVSEKVNSPWLDYAPVVNADETVMIFTTRRQEDNLNENVDEDNFYFEDIFISEKGENGEWSSAKNLGVPVNDEFHNSNLALSADGQTLFVYRYDNGGDIFFSTKEPDGSWSYPEPLNKYINSSFAEKSVSMSPDGQLLFYSSNRPGGLGGIDIYVSTKDANGEWGRSKNLGPIINTKFDDESPFIHHDGKTLYFSTKGRKGMGGYDIFKSEYDSVAGEWTEPVNIGYPINTPDNDVFFVATKDGERGYYASVREDGQGYTDIYMVNFLEEEVAAKPVLAKKEEPKREEPKKEEPKKQEEKPVEAPKALQPVTLTIRVSDNATGRPLPANINLRKLSNNQVAGKESIEEGIYQFTIVNKEPTEMMLSIEKDGYMFKNFRLTLPASTEEAQHISRNVELDMLRVGLSSVLRNIYFDFDKATFQKNSFDELNKLERLLNENPDIVVEISGHTDNIGGAAYNKQLSQLRADAVVNYVVQKGISKARVIAKGYGEERPLASNDDEKEGRMLNRRVEFKVLSKGGTASADIK
ncbi:OmpA family protein [Nafulsella turpanensis]|uniref:OmpA family protein n=1 Tax=Nafulsella turpanensis TaxID=1265690 RepID=UPI000348A05B|nr:OmpA family protein [Nafulsella turpanensis]